MRDFKGSNGILMYFQGSKHFKECLGILRDFNDFKGFNGIQGFFQGFKGILKNSKDFEGF